jgi:hypothetical protein
MARFHTFAFGAGGGTGLVAVRRTSLELGALASGPVSAGRHLLARQLVRLAMPCVEAEAFETEESPRNDRREVESLRMSKTN